jgi:hypothetical protein
LNNHQRSPRFHALVLIGFVICVGILFIYSFRFNEQVSEVENRRLAQWPVLNKESVLNGQYAKDVEIYVADHFPGRAWLTEVAFMIRTYRGIELKDRVIQVKGAETGFEDVSKWAGAETDPDTVPDTVPLIAPVITSVISPETSAETPSETQTLSAAGSVPEVIAVDEAPSENDFFVADEIEHVGLEIKPTSIPVVAALPKSEADKKPVPPKQVPPPQPTVTASPKVTAQPTVTAAPSSAPQQKPLNVVGGVLLHDGQALFMFQGTDRGAQGYANAVNTWVEHVAKKRPGMTSTVVVTPTSSHFYLPPNARARTTSEEKNLAAMRNTLLPEVRFADVIKEMEGHQDQPLFYKSDHHWTGLGAYYAYRAWAIAVGVVPLELSDFDKRSVPGVAGSFWSLTQAPELRHADKESFYYVPKTVTFDGTQFTGPQQKTPVPQPFFAEKSRGYIVFLGGDIPLLASNTNAGTGRTALVVKNSYGNAFAPYLLPHFDRVVVLDYRYVSRNIQDIVDSFGVTDLVFVNATITANSGAHQERMRQVARGSSTAWLTEAEKRRLKQQEDAAQQHQ